jgi:hypothetical protein
MSPSHYTGLLFALPGLLYFVNNNIPFYCLLYLDPASYMVLQQLKIGTTAVAFRILMGRVRFVFPSSHFIIINVVSRPCLPHGPLAAQDGDKAVACRILMGRVRSVIPPSHFTIFNGHGL